jgi:hypothetical protein
MVLALRLSSGDWGGGGGGHQRKRKQEKDPGFTKREEYSCVLSLHPVNSFTVLGRTVTDNCIISTVFRTQQIHKVA